MGREKGTSEKGEIFTPDEEKQFLSFYSDYIDETSYTDHQEIITNDVIPLLQNEADQIVNFYLSWNEIDSISQSAKRDYYSVVEVLQSRNLWLTIPIDYCKYSGYDEEDVENCLFKDSALYLDEYEHELGWINEAIRQLIYDSRLKEPYLSRIALLSRLGKYSKLKSLHNLGIDNAFENTNNTLKANFFNFLIYFPFQDCHFLSTENQYDKAPKYPIQRLYLLAQLAIKFRLHWEAIALGYRLREPVFVYKQLENDTFSPRYWESSKDEYWEKIKTQSKDLGESKLKADILEYYENWIRPTTHTPDDKIAVSFNLGMGVVIQTALGEVDEYHDNFQALYYGKLGN